MSAAAIAAPYSPATMLAAADFVAWLLDMTGGNIAAARQHVEREIEWATQLRAMYLRSIDARERYGAPTPTARDSRRRDYRRIAAISAQLSRLFAMREIIDGRAE